MFWVGSPCCLGLNSGRSVSINVSRTRKHFSRSPGSQMFPQCFPVSLTENKVSTVSFCFQDYAYATRHFNENPSMRVLAKVLGARASKHSSSPVPELSFLPAPYRGWTRAGERRVQDNLHAHAQNAAIFSPQIRGKTILGSTFQIWLVARFSEW